MVHLRPHFSQTQNVWALKQMIRGIGIKNTPFRQVALC